MGFLAGLCEIIFTMLMDAERNLYILPSNFATLEAPQKAKNRIIIWPTWSSSNSLQSGTYLIKSRSMHHRDPYTSMFIVALFTVVKLWKWPRCPSAEEW